jgi:hypothetical protein
MHRIAHKNGDSDEAALAIAENGLQAGLGETTADVVCPLQERLGSAPGLWRRVQGA